MTNDPNNKTGTPDPNNNGQEEQKEAPLVLHNPLDPNDDRKFTLDDVENEQKFKEALSERD